MSEITDHKDFLNRILSEKDLGSLFLEYNTIPYKSGEVLISHPIVYCNNYYFVYDASDALWKDTEETIVASRIGDWVDIEFKRRLRDLIEDASNVKIISELSKARVLYTRFCYLKNVLGQIKESITVPNFFEIINRVRPEFLPIRNNKVVNLETGSIRDRTVYDYFTYFCNVYPTKEKSEFFDKSISSIMCDKKDNLEYFQKILGYCLTGLTSAQSYFIWYGEGSNGKSLILNLLKSMLKEVCSPVSKSVIISSKLNSLNNGCEVAALKDLRVGFFTETNTQESLNEGILKNISGADLITARELYKKPITFASILKLIICTNHKPVFNANDAANIRRIKLLPFEAKFCVNPSGPNEYPINVSLEDELKTKYLDHFFTFCLEGSLKWFEDKKFLGIPNSILEYQKLYFESQNTLETWFSNRIDRGCRTAKLTKLDAYADYTKYTSDTIGAKPVSKIETFDFITKKVGRAIENKGREACWVGIQLISIQEDSDDEV